MKNILLLMLVAIVPYFTMAQKRSKKSNESFAKTSSYDFMLITGYHVASAEIESREGLKNQSPATQVKRLMNNNSRIKIEYDLPRRLKDEQIQLNETAATHRTMVDAVQSAAINGWEFQSANVVPIGKSKIYYYYMVRGK